MSAPDDLDDLRGQVNHTLADSLLDPVGGADATAQSPDVQSLAPGAQDAPFQTALTYPERMKVRGAMALSGADKRLDSTLGRMTGGAFDTRQIHQLEDRALVNAKPEDEDPLRSLQEGIPVVLTPQQKAIIDRLMSQSGSDALGQAAQRAYQKAWTNGQIKVRGN